MDSSPSSPVHSESLSEDQSHYEVQHGNKPKVRYDIDGNEIPRKKKKKVSGLIPITKRHRKVIRPNIDGVTKGSIKRLARRGLFATYTTACAFYLIIDN